MVHRLSLLATLAMVALAAPNAFGQQAASKEETVEALKWNLGRLSQEPLKLIKATPDAKKSQVGFVLEFSRDPGAIDVYNWTNGGVPAVFRFLDQDGVVLKTVRPKVEGELVPKKGSRIRLVLPMPDEKTLEKTYSVVAD
jgi:hypothetical protein